MKYEFDSKFTPSVDIFITVAGEPVEIVRETVAAAKKIQYPNFKIYILNDGYVAKKENWKDIEALAFELDVDCITRTTSGGAKAGNINNGLKETDGEFFVVFDADHVPHIDFLKKTVGYFINKKIAFVQTPQYYKNYEQNFVTRGAWEQQMLFFGPILKGKIRSNSVFMCGTNMVIRRKAILEVGGMCETNIAEDFLTSLFIHEKGWKSVYVPEVLAEGLAPEDFLSYYKQQFRWARGSLEVIFRYNPLFRKGLTFRQKIEYLTSSSYYLTGLIVLMNMILPLIFFFTGLTPIITSTMVLAAFFIPYMFVNIYALQTSSGFNYTFQALSFSLSSFEIHIKALWAVLFNKKTEFAVTSKKQIQGNFINLVKFHLFYILVVLAGIIFAFLREKSLTPSLTANIAWALVYIAIFTPFIRASLPEKAEGDMVKFKKQVSEEA